MKLNYTYRFPPVYAHDHNQDILSPPFSLILCEGKSFWCTKTFDAFKTSYFSY